MKKFMILHFGFEDPTPEIMEPGGNGSSRSPTSRSIREASATGEKSQRAEPTVRLIPIRATGRRSIQRNSVQPARIMPAACTVLSRSSYWTLVQAESLAAPRKQSADAARVSPACGDSGDYRYAICRRMYEAKSGEQFWRHHGGYR